MSAVFVTLDPGQRTGVAVWDADTFNERVRPVSVSMLTVGPGRREWPWAERCKALGDKFAGLFKWQTVVRVYCELPAFFEGATGHAAAAKGDVVKLAYLVGVYAGICHARGVVFSPVPVIEWKGQLSKEIVARRIVKKIGRTAQDGQEFHADIWDAVGIGLYVKGLF